MKWVGKTRTVRIATDQGDRTYHSIEDVPPDLRQVVKHTLEGPNSQTVLIANQEAYERLNVQFRELPANLEEVARGVAERPENRNALRLWKWAVAGSLSLLLTLWLLWVWVIRNDTW
jgi:hypothetical protein